MTREPDDRDVSVFFFLPQLGSGGAEMNAVRLAAGLLRHRVKPVYVVLRGSGSYTSYLPEEVEVIVLGNGSVGSSSLGLAKAIAPLAALLETRRPDIVVPVMAAPALAALAAIGRLSAGPRVALSIQNTLVPPESAGLHIVDRLVCALGRWLFPRADRVIALSQGVASDLLQRIPALSGRVDVVYNVGVPLPSQLAVVERPYGRSTAGRLRFLACGRLVVQKGYPVLLHAFAAVARDRDVELHILGEGPLCIALEELARRLNVADRVAFLGFRCNPFVHMREADVFILSSLWEGFGNVLVEAMAMGTPVLSTACPHGPAEIITDQVDGLLVPPGDAAALAAAMRLLADDVQLRKRLSTAGLMRAEDFSEERISCLFAAVLRDIVS